MKPWESVRPPFVRSVFHPTDLSESSQAAFVHALAIALHRRSELTILHAGSRRSELRSAGTRMPAVRGTLQRWGLLEEGSPRSAVFDDLAVRVKKVGVVSRNPLDGALDWLGHHPTDLIVLATEGRDGLNRWMNPSIAERLARRSGAMTLFVPDGARGMVSRDTGEVRLERILVPVDHRPDPGPALTYAVRVAEFGGGEAVEITLVHVGRTAPRIDPPASDSCRWSRLTRSGNVVDEIVDAAEELRVDLVVMATEGHNGILDALRGSVTEQVLRRSPCPVLAVPAAAPRSR